MSICSYAPRTDSHQLVNQSRESANSELQPTVQIPTVDPNLGTRSSAIPHVLEPVSGSCRLMGHRDTGRFVNALNNAVIYRRHVGNHPDVCAPEVVVHLHTTSTDTLSKNTPRVDTVHRPC